MVVTAPHVELARNQEIHDDGSRFGAAQFPLTDVSVAISWRGVPYMLRDHAAQYLRRFPRLSAFVGRAVGKPGPREDY